MTEICETFNLPEKIKNEYFKKLFDNHISTINQDGIPCLNKFFLKAFSSMEKNDFAEIIKKTAHNDEFLTTMIKLGGCLTMFGIRKDELFHTLNIVAFFMNFPQCRFEDCEKILGWINYCFPFNEVNKIDEVKVQLQKSLDILDAWRL